MIHIPGLSPSVHTSRLYGLTVASPFVLGHPVLDGGRPDILITVDDERLPVDHEPAVRGRLVAADSPGRPSYELFDRGPDGYFYRLHDFVEIDIAADQSAMHCRMTAGASEGMLPVMLSGHLMATLLLLRGELVFHASAVEVGGVAIAFVGHSGAGKSTLAALACRQGARLVTDDVLRVQATATGPICFRGGTYLRLRPQSNALAGSIKENHDSIVSADGRHLLPPAAVGCDQVPLAVIFIPTLRQGPDQGIVRTRLDPKSALLTLIQFPRVYNWTDPETSATHFEKLATIVQSVSVHSLDLPWGIPIGKPWFDSFADLVLSPTHGSAHQPS